MKRTIPILFAVLAAVSCDDNKNGDQDLLDKLDLPESVTFTYLPTDLNSMGTFGAIGQVYGIPKGHGGFTVKAINFTNPTIPVYAMSDGVIYNIRWESLIFPSVPPIPADLQGKEYDDYAYEIALSKAAKMHYGHLSKPAPEILSKAGTLKKGRGVENRVEISFKAGDIIAYVGVHPGFDIGLNDSKKEHYLPTRTDTPKSTGAIFRSLTTSLLT